MNNHHPKLAEQLFFLLSGALVSSPLPFFYGEIIDFLKSERLGDLAIVLIVTVVFAPLFEEFAKSFPLFYRHGESERSLFKLGFLTGLGFGIIEVLIYVFIHDVAFWVRLPGMFFHASSTAIVAYGIGKNRPFSYYLIAVGLHAINNFVAHFDYFYYVFGVASVITAYTLAFYLSRKTTNRIIGL